MALAFRNGVRRSVTAFLNATSGVARAAGGSDLHVAFSVELIPRLRRRVKTGSKILPQNNDISTPAVWAAELASRNERITLRRRRKMDSVSGQSMWLSGPYPK